ncbi:MAG: methyl-accepting chemotaxis protein [Methylovulum sp.]|nr:MAG: methyl-accepting chemotaxis protein [Methylovulum sp.]
MDWFRSLKLWHRFTFLIGLFAFGFIVYGAWSFKTLNEIMVNGPVYQRIVQGKDLIADILPPPEYVIESYLVALQLSETGDSGEQDHLIERLKKLKGEYDERHTFWLNEKLDWDLSETFLNQAHPQAVNFYTIAFNEYIPAVKISNKDTAKLAMSRMKAAYELHRTAIDKVVELAGKRNKTDEAGAKANIQSAGQLLLAILVVSLVAAVAVATMILRGLLTRLGGEPEYAVKIAHDIAACNLSINIETRADDETSLLAAMKAMQGSLALTIGNVNNSVHKLERAAARLTQTAGLVVENNLHQQEVSHSMAAAVEEMSSTVVEITSTMEELSASSTQIADHSTSVVDIANHTLENSKKGSDSMQQLLTRMGDIRTGNQNSLREIVELGAKSKEISKVMEIINAIADQTKLIAFNAALEAASAGESGRRFGVVAAEIRRLADSVTDSTNEIENKIQEIQDSISRLVITSEKGTSTIDAGMAASAETARHLDDLVDAAGQTSSAAQQISLSTQQQKTASSQVVSALREIVTASAHTAQSIRSITEIGNEMNAMSRELSKLVNQFKLADA